MIWADVSRDRLSDIVGLDPYADWILGEDNRFRFDVRAEHEQIYPVLIELIQTSVAAFARGDQFFDPRDQDTWRECIVIPAVLLTASDEQARELIDGFGFTTALVKPVFFRLLRHNQALRDVVRSVSLSRPVEGMALSFTEKSRSHFPALDIQSANGSEPTNEAIIGVIDDAIAFAHERFRCSSTSTRVEHIWIQSQSRADDPTSSLFGRGVELHKADINNALVECATDGVVDEEWLYRKLGLLDFTSDLHKGIAHRGAHGTHVLDLAAGGPPGTKPNRPIVCVQLPVAVTADTSGVRLSQWVVEAVWYILLRSLEISSKRRSRPLPVVINLSYGFTAGPHDGTLPLERALQRAVDVWERVVGSRVRIVLPAGNHFESRMHASIAPPQGSHTDIAWRIHPDDRTSSHVEIWMPRRRPGEACPAKVSVCPPGVAAPLSPAIGASAATAVELRKAGQLVCQAAISHTAGHDRRAVIRVSVAPTFELERPASAAISGAAAGVWRLRIENVSLREGERVEAWIQRDDNAYNFPLVARQSRFELDDPDTDAAEEHDRTTTTVHGAGTLNAIATGFDPRIVVVGGYVASTRSVAPYSSSGPTCGERVGPDCVAVSDRSGVAHGVLAAGPYSGTRMAMNGTSVAAPKVTSLIADNLAAGGAGDAAFLSSIAAIPDSVAAQVSASKRGRLDERIGAGFIPDTLPMESVFWKSKSSGGSS